MKLLCVSRISKEKNLEDFFRLKGDKTMVGDGPMLAEYRKKYPDVNFVGAKFGEELANYYRSADVFVFPSKTDTFGIVMIEAMSCGVPVAAYPVQGPIDVVIQNVNGYLHTDLAYACLHASYISREIVHEISKRWTWESCAQQLLNALKGETNEESIDS